MCAIQAEWVCRVVLLGVGTCSPFEEGILQAWKGGLVVHPLGYAGYAGLILERGKEGEGGLRFKERLRTKNVPKLIFPMRNFIAFGRAPQRGICVMGLLSL